MENDSIPESFDGDGDEDSLRLIAEGLESQNTHNPNGTNIAYTVFLITNAALGAGLLNFPKSYDDAGGILVAFFVQLVLLLFIMIALIGLAYASDQCGSGGALTIQVKHKTLLAALNFEDKPSFLDTLLSFHI